jgi:formylmethanofuran dehydrogenase subunit E
MNIPDNYDQWEAHELDQERRLAELPVCDICDDPIQDDFYYEINGENICEHCMDQFFRKEIDHG